MKILIISPNKIWGGAATANIAIASILKRIGHQVMLNDEYYNNDSYNDIEIDHFPTRGNIFRQKTFISYLRSNHVDVIIWGNVLLFQYYFPSVRKIQKMGIRQIAVLHSLSLSNSFRGKLTEWIISKMSNYLNTIVCVSEYTRRSWCKYSAFRKNKNKMMVIHNSIREVGLPRSLNYDSKGPIRIGFVGRFSNEKQPEIFCSLSEKSNYEFHAFGFGPMMEQIQSKFPNVIYHGQVSEEEKIYSNIDILLVTSKFENCPMVILEAMSHGIPVVAPKVGGIPEITNHEEDSVLYEGYSSMVINEAINRIIDNYERYSKKCIENAEKYTSTNIASYWETIL